MIPPNQVYSDTIQQTTIDNSLENTLAREHTVVTNDINPQLQTIQDAQRLDNLDVKNEVYQLPDDKDSIEAIAEAPEQVQEK